jgi:hypothetical protein
MIKVLLLSLTLLFSSTGFAQSGDIAITPKGCAYLAQGLEIAASIRNTTTLDQQIAEVTQIKELQPQLLALVILELKSMYSVYKNLTPDEIGGNFFKKYYENQGILKKMMPKYHKS